MMSIGFRTGEIEAGIQQMSYTGTVSRGFVPLARIHHVP